jgi:hypothetical protein
LESKKRCHDLIHRESDERDILRKSTYFPEEPKAIWWITQGMENSERERLSTYE